MINWYSLIVIFFFSYLQSGISQNQGLAFIEDFNQAKKLAEKEDKFIFVDVMADWCEPCKKMVKEVYSDPEVINYFNKRFISVKLDGERRGAGFVRKNRVNGFPTMLFFNTKGKELHRIDGYANVQRLMMAADVSLRNPKRRSAKFREDYRKYKENPKYLRDYMLFCEETEDYDLADKLSDQYVKYIAKVDSAEWMDLVLRFVHKEKSKLFDLLKENKKEFAEVYGKDDIDKVFLDILINEQMWKMTEPSTEKLFNKTRDRIEKHKLRIRDKQIYPALANRAFNLELQFKNDEARADLAVRTLKDHSTEVDKKIIPTMLANVAIQKEDKRSLTVAKDHIYKLIAEKPSMYLHDINSIILYKLGEKEESFRQVALAQKYAVETNQSYKSSLKIMKDSGLVK